MPHQNIRGFKSHTIRDGVRYLYNAARLRLPAFMVIQRLDACTPGEQIVGTAVALIAMCQGANISLSDVLSVAGNALSDADGPFQSHIAAIRDYAANELARHESKVGGLTSA